LFALQLAAAGHRVLAVEENPAAVADGLESQRALRIGASRCRFVRESVRRVTTWSRHVRGTVDLVVLDPPRDGVGGELLRRILETLTPRQVAYVSCDPVSLARDLEALRSPGAALPYDIDVVEPVDMFPHTAHLETFAWIVRREPTTAARAAGRTTTARPGGRSRSDRGTRTDRDAPPARRRRTR
jgi:tRNA/tmRNA/rRNA uracil-C5-methylase (TrmA/RlmC/RlmD family)